MFTTCWWIKIIKADIWKAWIIIIIWIRGAGVQLLGSDHVPYANKLCKRWMFRWFLKVSVVSSAHLSHTDTGYFAYCILCILAHHDIWQYFYMPMSRPPICMFLTLICVVVPSRSVLQHSTIWNYLPSSIRSSQTPDSSRRYSKLIYFSLPLTTPSR